MEKLINIVEFAKKENIKFDILIKLAASGKFPIYIVSDNWYCHIWKKLNVDDDIDENIDFGDFTCETPLEKPIILKHVPIQLKTSSIVAYQINKFVNISRFEARDMIKGPEEYIFELRLCDPSDFHKTHSIILEKDMLAADECSLTTIKKLLEDNLIDKESEITAHEKKKLLRIIGALAMVLTDTKKYTFGIKPNVSQISNSILDTFDTLESKEILINQTGLGDSTLRDVIKEGLDTLVKY